MEMQSRLGEEMKKAMREKDTARLSTLRMLKAAFLNEEKSGKGELTEADGLRIVRSLIKQRVDAAKMMRDGGREESAVKEEAEIEILNDFLPPPMHADEMTALVDQAISATGAQSIKQMGAVMGWLKKNGDERADFGQLSAQVKARLN
uniref:Glutamyl-tRNA amidotransferase n=1 Tax=Magnetococcus massalia (strain MO-1) TaxID=451514 RepID=A0A1S7LLJ8_MAGMO|nr:conserved protein of unknown function [Include GatB/Yqey domain] [Candidatus Magnetococcus massalia]